MLVDGAMSSTMQWQLEMARQSVTDGLVANCSNTCERGTVLLDTFSKNTTAVFIATHCKLTTNHISSYVSSCGAAEKKD
jgi:hypothetical protein